MKMIRTITVYCGSSDHTRAEFIEAAYQTGKMIARRGHRLAYGAGKTGLMGALADGALQAGGEVVGVIPEFFNQPSLVHNRLSKLVIVETMHQRKAALAEMGDAFIVLPGGLGTFDEFFEILTWSQIGLHHKPIGLLNVHHYFHPFFALIQNAQAEGLVGQDVQRLFVHSDQPEGLLKALHEFQRLYGENGE